MSAIKSSAEVVELEDARARLRAAEIDPKNFLAVGPYLEAVRVQQGVTLATLSDTTHIKASYLEAIEQMAVDKLPNKAVATGFVRGYAKALGLDSGPLVARFKEEAGLAARKSGATEADAKQKTASAPEPMRLSLIAVLAVLGFMIWCAWLVTHPGPDAVKRPLKLDGVPLAAAPVESEPVAEAPPPPPAEHTASSVEVPPLPVVVEAAVLERVEPVYPPGCEASAAALESVAVAFTVTPDGAVVSERVAESSNSCFDRAALNAVKRWRFSPRTIDGAPRPAFEQTTSFRFERPS